MSCALVETAGFTQTTSGRPRAGPFASARDLVLAYGTGSPLAAHLAGVDDATHEALVASVESALGSDKRDRELSFPIEALLLSAVAPTDPGRQG
jgi:hypothetical protein